MKSVRASCRRSTCSAPRASATRSRARRRHPRGAPVPPAAPKRFEPQPSVGQHRRGAQLVPAKVRSRGTESSRSPSNRATPPRDRARRSGAPRPRRGCRARSRLRGKRSGQPWTTPRSPRSSRHTAALRRSATTIAWDREPIDKGSGTSRIGVGHDPRICMRPAASPAQPRLASFAPRQANRARAPSARSRRTLAAASVPLLRDDQRHQTHLVVRPPTGRHRIQRAGGVVHAGNRQPIPPPNGHRLLAEMEKLPAAARAMRPASGRAAAQSVNGYGAMPPRW